MNPSTEHAGHKIIVYDYYTLLADGRKIRQVRSAKPATLDLIQDLDAEAIPGSSREVDEHEVCDLGFFRGSHVSRSQHPN